MPHNDLILVKEHKTLPFLKFVDSFLVGLINVVNAHILLPLNANEYVYNIHFPLDFINIAHDT